MIQDKYLKFFISTISLFLLVVIFQIKFLPSIIELILLLFFGITFYLFSTIEYKMTLLTILCFSIDWLTYDTGILPSRLILSIDFIIVLIFIDTIVKKKCKYKVELFDIIFFIFLIIWGTSIYINNIGIIRGILQLRSYIRFIFIYYIIRSYYISEYILKKQLKLIFIISLLQLPIVIIQRLSGSALDLCSGSFGYHQTGVMAVFMSGLILLILLYSEISKKKWVFLLSILFIIPSIVNSASMIFFLVLYAVLFVILYKKNIGNILKYSFLLGFFIIIIILGMKELTGRNLVNDFVYNFDYIIETQSKERSAKLGRIGALKWVNYEIKTDYKTLLLGLGPGVYRGVLGSSDYYTESLSEGLRNMYVSGYGYSSFLFQWGYLGFMLFVVMVLSLLKGYDKNKIKNNNDILLRTVYYGFPGIIILFILANLYTLLWESVTFGYAFWLISGICYRMQNGIYRYENT